MTATSDEGGSGGGAAPAGGPDERLRRLVHDLRTPLTLVSGFADLLQRRTDLSEEQRAEYAGRIVEAAADLRGLLDEVGRGE